MKLNEADEYINVQILEAEDYTTMAKLFTFRTPIGGAAEPVKFTVALVIGSQPSIPIDFRDSSTKVKCGLPMG